MIYKVYPECGWRLQLYAAVGYSLERRGGEGRIPNIYHRHALI